ncbi:sulfite exporter TauE/SafE family protein [Aureimonas mangrovi]|uniref:sulfite exporter TauE/SafE family protein n=1 Tax=Aureimonas mangrovi TaxID=2758041 RepID=UPI00163DAD86|nr:sulfite exporter TauE/SafE family protein [Aureimonas mangrovi]
MDVLTIAFLFVAGLLAGAINAIAGGGTFLTFGAYTLAGLPPISASASSAVSQFPGYVTSTLAYWSDLKKIWRSALVLALVSMFGAAAGAFILVSLDNAQFRVLVPWLLLAATAVFAAGPYLKPAPRPQDATPSSGADWKSPVVQFFTAIYGGFFQAGMGIIMLATLGLTVRGEYHRLNSIKNLLSNVISLVAILVFVSGGIVAWTYALSAMPGVALGGYGGVWIAKRVPQAYVRALVVVIGLLLSAYYFISM